MTDFQTVIFPLLECATPDEAEKKFPFFNKETLVRTANMCKKLPAKQAVNKAGADFDLRGRFDTSWLLSAGFKHRLVVSETVEKCDFSSFF